jgi:DNA-binding transcriptional ArsR family regulator
MNRADAVFKAIAHPARREIIALLSVSHRSVKELTSAFNMSQPAVSQHLRELKRAKLVRSMRVGVEQHYHLREQSLRVVFDWARQYRRFFDPAGHAWAFVSAAKAGARHGR